MFLGIDCFSPLSRIQAEATKAAGFDFVGRYLIPPEYYRNGLSTAEAHAISAAGLGLLCVYETQADRAKQGAEIGRKDAEVAVKQAQRISMPKNTVIYFAVDFAPNIDDYPAIAGYMYGAKDVISKCGYRLGVYGSYYVVEAMAQWGFVDACWQCVGWSNGKVSRYMDVYQKYWSGADEAKVAAAKIGVSLDINECDDLQKAGIWMYEEDEKMEINRMLEVMTDEQAARIVEKAQQYFAKMPLPGSWDAEGELDAAIKMGITDGSRPMSLATRLETAVMFKRALEDKAVEEEEEPEEETSCDGDACDIPPALLGDDDRMEDDLK